MSKNNNINESDDISFHIFKDSNEIKKENQSNKDKKPEKTKNLFLTNLDNNEKYSKEEKEALLKKKLEQEKEKNKIRNKLKCFICIGKVQNAMMCPFCKKLACEQCFKKVLQKTNICSNCKSILLINELVKMPLWDDFTAFFINNMEQNYEDEEDKDDEEEFNEIRKQKCQEHPNKNLEYICMNCKEYLCSESLLFFNKESVNKHFNHIIYSFDDIEKFKLFKIIKEYRNLSENKNKLNSKLIDIKKGMKEIDQRKRAINYICNSLKNDIKSKYDKKILDMKSILNTMKNKKRLIQNKIQNPPNLMMELNSEENCKKILEELKSLNYLGMNEVDLENESKFQKTIKCEQYETEPIEIKLPNNGQYIEEYTIINQELNFIPDIKSKLNCQLLLNNCILTFVMKIDKNFINQHSEKFIGYLYLENNANKKSKSLEGNLFNNEIILSAQYDFNEIKKIMNYDDKWYCKINITKFYYK